MGECPYRIGEIVVSNSRMGNCDFAGKPMRVLKIDPDIDDPCIRVQCLDTGMVYGGYYWWRFDKYEPKTFLDKEIDELKTMGYR